MSLVEKLQAKLLEARKSHDDVAKNVLSVALGDIQTQGARQKGDLTDQQGEKVVQKLIKSNQETMAVADETRRAILQREVDILTALLPQACSREQITAHLSTVVADLKAAKSDGQATGVAMKALASLPGSKDGKLVAEIVKELRAT